VRHRLREDDVPHVQVVERREELVRIGAWLRAERADPYGRGDGRVSQRLDEEEPDALTFARPLSRLIERGIAGRGEDQRCPRCVVAAVHAWRGVGGARRELDGADIDEARLDGGEGREIERPGPEDAGGIRMHLDHSGLDAVRAGTSVEDEVHALSERRRDVRGRRRRQRLVAVRARRGDRLAESAEKRARDRMRRRPEPDGWPAARQLEWDMLGARHDEGERAGPEGFGESSAGARPVRGECLRVLRTKHMRDQRMRRGPPLCREDPREGGRVERPRSQPVDRLGRECDEPSAPEDRYRTLDLGNIQALVLYSGHATDVTMHRPRSLRIAILRTLLVAAGAASLCGVACVPAKTAVVLPAPAPPPSARRVVTEANVGVTWSTKATLKLMSTWSRCHASFSAGGGDTRAEVARLAGGCVETTKMHRLGEPFTGEQKASDRPQTFNWKARAGHCYRAYGVGASGVKNLDLLLQDSDGVVLGQDGTDDGAPVVLDAGAACFKQDDEASVVVSVGDGAGAFAVEMWED
jgi:hypothetical protein